MSSNSLRLELLLNASRASENVRRFARGAQRELGGLGRETQHLSRSFNGLSAAWRLFAGVGVVMAARQMLNGMNELEKAMLRVESNLIGGAKSATDLQNQLKGVRDTARELSRMTVFSDAEMVGLTNQLLKSGVRQADLNGPQGAAAATAGLAQLGGLSPETAAGYMGAFSNAFGMRGSQLYGLADQFVRVDDASAMNSGDLAYNFKQVNATAAAMHLDPKQIVTALGYVDSLGNEAGTALNRFIENLASPTRMKMKAMRKSGMDFWDEGKDGSVKLKDFNNVINIVRDRYGNMKDQHKMLVELHKIFGEEGARFAELVAHKSTTFDAFEAQVNSATGINKKLEIQAKGLSAAFERLKNTVFSAADKEFAPERDALTTGTKAMEHIVNKGQGHELLGAGAAAIGLGVLLKLNKAKKLQAAAAVAEKAAGMDKLAQAAQVQKVFVTNWPASMQTAGEKVRGKLGQNSSGDAAAGAAAGSAAGGGAARSSKMAKVGKGLAVFTAGFTGYEFGSEVVKPLIDSVVESVTEREGNSLGGAIYDLLNRSEVKSQVTVDMRLPDYVRVNRIQSDDQRVKVNVDTGPIMPGAH